MAELKRFLFSFEETRLRLAESSTGMDLWREHGGDDQDKFQSWIRSYRKALDHRQGPDDLLGLGKEIYAWLNGDGDFMEKALSQAEQPFLVEFRVNRQPDETAKRFLEVPGRTWSPRRPEPPLPTPSPRHILG